MRAIPVSVFRDKYAKLVAEDSSYCNYCWRILLDHEFGDCVSRVQIDDVVYGFESDAEYEAFAKDLVPLGAK